jgi:hypothetical protein
MGIKFIKLARTVSGRKVDVLLFSIVATVITITISSEVTAQTNDAQHYLTTEAPTKVFWGDTHLHTRISGDARGYGNTLSPDDAYRIAKGETIESSTGQQVKLNRPLDFIVIADHAEGFAIMDEIYSGNKLFTEDPTVARWSKMLNTDRKQAIIAIREIIVAQGGGTLPKIILDNPEFTKNAWEQYLKVSEAHNQPGKFTVMHGFEWSAMKKGNNLHRVVIYRDGIDKVSQTLPIDSNRTAHDPEQLWEALAAYEKRTKGNVLAIPHNPNLSGGLMFAFTKLNGAPLDKEYNQLRERWEPLVEITQIKGDSETHPFLSPNDEFADYETWDVANLSMVTKTTKSQLPGSYVRDALKRGLLLYNKTGANPYKFGVIGSSDSHTGIVAGDESEFYGKHSSSEPSPKRWDRPVSKSQNGVLINPGWKMASAGLAAVWAPQNTREGIFDAMQRKETYATTGPRIQLRMFASWAYDDALLSTHSWLKTAYMNGVPMGGTLLLDQSDQTIKSPTFLINAIKDPMGANLDRAQIIKGWIDQDGELHETVFNVAWSGDRKLDANGKLNEVGNTVDVANATYTNAIGSEEFLITWQDPTYQANQKSFYYTRILEIPTPRWTAYDAKKFAQTLPDGVSMIVTERAYSSAIWVN